MKRRILFKAIWLITLALLWIASVVVTIVDTFDDSPLTIFDGIGLVAFGVLPIAILFAITDLSDDLW